ncbi:MAG: hypothetical protein SFV15_10225 [Polyangiaceae bacterium]|nr:hypothetical protein [Polyangiaceae bacterium]
MDGFLLTQWGRWTHEEALAALDQAAAMGARHVSILAHLSMPGWSASTMHWGNPNDSFEASYQGQRLARLLPAFGERKLELGLVPVVQAQGLNSRQWVWPGDRRAWFRAYADRLVELARWGESAGAKELVVASELTLLLAMRAPWVEVVTRLRRVFHGHLTVSPVFPQYPWVRWWDCLDSIGVSAYFPLALSQNASANAMERGWRVHRVHLIAFSRLHSKPLTFVEVGYPCTHVAASRPWDFAWAKRTLDLDQPARCWEAFRRVWAHDDTLRSFRIWGLSAQPNVEPKAFEPWHKPSEAVVRRLFAERQQR